MTVRKGLGQANILRTNNNTSTGYGIAYADEVSGHRTVANLTALYALNDWQLSASGDNTGSDAIGQLWYVVNADGNGNGAFYQLKDWNKRKEAAGWSEFKGTGASTAAAVTFDNTASGMTAVNAQDAIEELNVKKLDKPEVGGTKGQVLSLDENGNTIWKNGETGAPGPQGPQGNTGSSVEYPFELVNNLETDDATKALSAQMGKKLGEDNKVLNAKVDGTFVEITNKYQVSNGAMDIRAIKVGATLANYTIHPVNNYRTVVIDGIKKGEKFYVVCNSYNYYPSVLFVNTNTNIVVSKSISNVGYNHKVQVTAPESADRMIFTTYVGNNENYGIYKNYGIVDYDYKLDVPYNPIHNGYLSLLVKGTTTIINYFNNQQVELKRNTNSNYGYYNIPVKEGELYYLHSSYDRAEFLYVLLDKNDYIVSCERGHSFDGFITIPEKAVRLIAHIKVNSGMTLGAERFNEVLQICVKKEKGRSIARFIRKGLINAINTSNVGDIVENLNFDKSNNFFVGLLEVCHERELVSLDIGDCPKENLTLAFLDKDNKLIYKESSNSVSVKTCIAPEGSEYLYIAFRHLGDSIPITDIYTKVKIDISNVKSFVSAVDNKSKNKDFVVPNVFRGIVGQQKVVYYDNLIEGLDNGLDSPCSLNCVIQSTFDNKDMNYDRCWSISSDMLTNTYLGNHAFNLTAYDKKIEEYATKKCYLKIIPKTGLSNSHNICIIGDSNIDGSYILKAIYDRFAWLGGTQPTMVGSKSSTIEGVTIKHEGRSGWTTSQMVGTGSPFYNSTSKKLDVASYRSNNSISGVIDVAVIALGINECILTGNSTYNTIKPLIDAFLADNPNCKVILELPHLGANTMGGGWSAYPYASKKISYYKNVIAQRKSYIDFFENSEEYKDKVIIGEGCYALDRYYGFPYSQKKMSELIDVQEFVHTNCVHPNNDGYKQEGYAYFVTILDMLQTIEAEN